MKIAEMMNFMNDRYIGIVNIFHSFIISTFIVKRISLSKISKNFFLLTAISAYQNFLLKQKLHKYYPPRTLLNHQLGSLRQQ